MIRACEWCGKTFDGIKTNQRYCCEVCRRAAKKERNRAWEANNRAKINYEPCVTILHDPDPEGGFSLGSQITKISFRDMLEMGNCTPGTRIRDGASEYIIAVSASGRGVQQKVKV